MRLCRLKQSLGTYVVSAHMANTYGTSNADGFTKDDGTDRFADVLTIGARGRDAVVCATWPGIGLAVDPYSQHGASRVLFGQSLYVAHVEAGTGSPPRRRCTEDQGRHRRLVIPVLSYPQLVAEQAKEHAQWRQQAGVDEDDTEPESEPEDDTTAEPSGWAPFWFLFRRPVPPVTGDGDTPTQPATGPVGATGRNPFRKSGSPGEGNDTEDR